MNLLIFGYGYSSHAFVARYGDIFSTIHATTRSADKFAQMDGVKPVLFTAAEEALAQADVILVSAPPDAESDPVLRHYADAFETAPAQRIIYLSTVGVYGDHQGAWVDEDTPCVPVAERSHARLSAEQAWSECAADMGAELDILRLSGIYGPQRNALANLREGTARRIIKPGQVFNRIHVADIADAIAACIARGQPGRIYNVTDDEPAPPQDVVTCAAKIMGVEPPPEVAFADAMMSHMARSFYSECKRVSNARIKQSLGWQLVHPTYEQALKAMWAEKSWR